MAVSNATVTRIAANSAVAQDVAAANRNRRGLLIYNESTAVCYVKCGQAASSTDYSIQIAAGKAVNFKGNPIYVGLVTFRHAATNGAIQVTEFYG